ncbi:hypothetical protein, partial [Zavarzinella formosa]|uniref:hypothetical protein n=1 Tax=Zavarzinella formosa TaxID=360055 RepID=UPI001EE66F07
NDYRDGSGSWIRIELFESREEAQVFVEKWCADYFSKFDPARPHGLGYILDKCQQHGIAVPAAISAFDRNQKLEAAKKQAAEAENNLQKHRTLIAELEPA